MIDKKERKEKEGSQGGTEKRRKEGGGKGEGKEREKQRERNRRNHTDQLPLGTDEDIKSQSSDVSLT